VERALAERYLDLLAGCLTRDLFAAEQFEPVSAAELPRVAGRARAAALGPLLTPLAAEGIRLMRPAPVGQAWIEARAAGDHDGWPRWPETMIGRARLDNLRDCIRTVIDDGVPGDVIETGVWRGGAAIFARGALEAYGDPDRLVWLADSFEGLPPPDVDRYPADRGWDLSDKDDLAVSQEQVRANAARYGLLDDRMRFLPGWFADTLAHASIESLAVIRLDGDLYESTIQALDALYPELSKGGFVIVDDYNLAPCRSAVTDYRRDHDILAEMVDIDGKAAYWRREG
jgi:O-methyltransferase